MFFFILVERSTIAELSFIRAPLRAFILKRYINTFNAQINFDKTPEMFNGKFMARFGSDDSNSGRIALGEADVEVLGESVTWMMIVSRIGDICTGHDLRTSTIGQLSSLTRFLTSRFVSSFKVKLKLSISPSRYQLERKSSSH